MKRSTALLVLPLMLGVAIAQSQISPPPKQAVAPNSPSESPANRVAVTAPRAIYSPDPKFPKKARKGHKKGEIVFSLVVGEDGLPRDIKFMRGVRPELDE